MFAIDGGVVTTPTLLVAGYAGLMAVVQLRLIRLYRSVLFGIGYGAFAFSYAAVVTNAARTLIALTRGTYLPRTAPAHP